MFCTDMMPRAANTPLEQRKRALNSVRMGIPDNIDSLGVIDSLVLSGRHSGPLNGGWIGWVVVSKDHFGICTDIFSDVLSESLGLHVLGMKQSQFSVALS